MTTRVLIVCSAAMMAASVNGADFHVLPAGNDAKAGTADHPFATLERARDAMRADEGGRWKVGGSASARSTADKGGEKAIHTIYLHGGTYRPEKTLILEPQDSGVTWAAYKDEKPVLTSAREITGWKPYADTSTHHLPPATLSSTLWVWPGNPDINAWIERLKGQKRFELSPEEIQQMHKLMQPS